GLVGFGHGGTIFHAPFLHAIDGLELTAILQRHGDSAAQAYPGVAIARSMDELLAQPELDLIVISTPPSTHFELARQALDADKHVVLDKPFVATSEEARQLIELARVRHRILSVYQNCRWDGDFQTLQKILASQELGRLVTLESRYDRYRPGPRTKPWQEKTLPGNGVLHDLAAHLVDQALVLFGTPEAILADVRLERDLAVVNDAFTLCLHYPRLRVWLSSTMLARTAGPRFVAHGTLGSFVKYGLDPQERALQGGAVLGGPHWGEDPEANWGTLATMRDGQPVERRVPTIPGDYRKYYENVRDAIWGVASLAVTAEQGWRTIRLLELALESSAQRCAISCAELDQIP
ncbi:MAG TPA: Gfo/Idh/MocA family oxidoreductase, partial [Acidobacteriaceae bacterium]|nr:Gfo/Idh/MocA family oxidoreductase [Acidobacteriaceae bacterium]